MPKGREQFICDIKKGSSFDFAVAKIFPKYYLKHFIKKTVYKKL